MPRQSFRGPLAQSVEHRTFNPLVVGSIPTRPTTSQQSVSHSDSTRWSLVRFQHGPPLHRTSRFRIRTQPAGRWLDSNKAHHHAVPNLTWLGVFVSGLRDTTRASAPVCVCHAVTVRRPEVARFDSLYSVGDDPHLARASVRFEPMLALTAGSDGLAAPS